MPRAPRLYVRNGIYHAMTRGNRKQPIFEDVHDRRRFVKILATAAERYDVDVLAECRVGTHFHLIARTPRANISEFMCYLNGQYAKYSNRRHQRTGHLFGERFVPVLIDTGLYLRVAMSYVMNNPVAAGYVRCASDWKWSSCRAALGLETAPEYLSLDWLDASFPAPTRSESQALFAQYITAATAAEAELWFERVVIGGDAMRNRVRSHIGATLYTAAIPRAYRALHRPPLDELLPARLRKSARNSAILRAHVVHAYTMAEIGRRLGLHPKSVSRIICSVRPPVQ